MKFKNIIEAQQWFAKSNLSDKSAIGFYNWASKEHSYLYE